MSTRASSLPIQAEPTNDENKVYAKHALCVKRIRVLCVDGSV